MTKAIKQYLKYFLLFMLGTSIKYIESSFWCMIVGCIAGIVMVIFILNDSDNV